VGKPRPPILLPRPLSAALVVLFLAAMAAPFAGSALAVFGGGNLGGLEEVLSSGRIRGLLFRSILLAAMSATLASLLGIILGAALERLGGRGRWLALGLLAIPFSLSPVIAATGFLWALGPAGWAGGLLPWNIVRDLGGPALVLGLTGAPLSGVLVLAGKVKSDPDLRDAALLCSGRPRASLAIVFPPLLPYIASGWLIVFLLGLFSSAVPSLCRQSVLAEEILLRYSLHFDPTTAAFLSVLLAVIGLLVLAALRISFPPAALNAHGGRARAGEPRRARRAVHAALAIGVFFLASAGIPLTGHLSRFPALAELPRIAEDLLPPLGFTLGLSALGAAAALGLGFVWSMEVCCGRILRGPAGELLGLLPLCLPGPLLAIGLAHILDRGPLRGLLDTPWALAAAKGIAGSPYAFIVILVGLRSIPEAELEALALTRRSPWGLVLRRIAWHAALAFWLCFTLGIGETDLALLLTPPGTRPLPVKIYTIYHFGAPGDAAVLSLALSGLTLALACLAAAIPMKKYADR
jgi:ABC-type Fe3+ transport system permease subunit